ncbi:MAG: nicotinamide riboside transporter PnuC [Pseudomonadota bacterium]
MNNPDTPLMQMVWQSFLALSGWEVIGTILGITYVILAAKESIWCWPAALVSTLIYTILFWEGQLPMQALLNIYYMGMAIYGWQLWRTNSQTNEVLVISTRPGRFHIGFIASGVILTVITAYYLEQVIGSRLPYLDAFVTVFSVMNTVLMARKVLESWLYWIVINSAAIALYFQTGFYVTIVMFMVYLVLTIYGYKSWRALKIQAHTA